MGLVSPADIILTVGSGKITLSGTSNLDSLNIASKKIFNEWTLIGSTAKYSTPSKTLIAINGITVLDGAGWNKKVVKLSKSALSTSTVTISDGYELALAEDVTLSESRAAGYNFSIKTYYTKGTTAGYTLSSDDKTINYEKTILFNSRRAP